MNEILLSVVKNNKKKIIKKIKIHYPIKNKIYFVIKPFLFQTWNTKILPPKMFQATQELKKCNPGFKYYLFDDNDCYQFIRNNFDTDVFDAYKQLLPGAYKADLWRYCVLYKYGGVYLDIKYIPINGFKLINLLEKEQWVLDMDGNNIYNALMVCKPNNEILWKVIYQIVKHVKEKYYGNGTLDVTGPGLLSSYFSNREKQTFDLKHDLLLSSHDYRIINYKGYTILRSYDGYVEESRQFNKLPHYSVLWLNKNIYR